MSRLRPFLEDNGWELVGYHARDRSKAYYRAPCGTESKNFTIQLAVPNDKATLRVAIAMISHAERTPAPGDSACFEGRIGRYGARFDMDRFFDSLRGPYRPSGTEADCRECSPSRGDGGDSESLVWLQADRGNLSPCRPHREVSRGIHRRAGSSTASKPSERAAEMHQAAGLFELGSRCKCAAGSVERPLGRAC